MTYLSAARNTTRCGARDRKAGYIRIERRCGSETAFPHRKPEAHLDCRILLIKLLVCFSLVTVTATSNPPARFSAFGR